MKDTKDMKIGESFYLKRTVAVISERTNTPCEYDEERIDVNAIIIEELEKINTEIYRKWEKQSEIVGNGMLLASEIINKHISKLKGE